MQRAVGFRCDLAEDQQHEGQATTPAATRNSPPSRQAISPTSVGADDVDDRAQQQDQADQPVRAREQLLGEARAAMAAFARWRSR